MKLHEKLDKTLEDQEIMREQIDELQERVECLQEKSENSSEQINEIYAAQAGDTVSKTSLDTAYREGVNSYTGTETTIETQELDAAYEE